MKKLLIFFGLIFIATIGNRGLALSAEVVYYDVNNQGVSFYATEIRGLQITTAEYGTRTYNVDFIGANDGAVVDNKWSYSYFHYSSDAFIATDAVCAALNAGDRPDSMLRYDNITSNPDGYNLFVIPSYVDGENVVTGMGRYGLVTGYESDWARDASWTFLSQADLNAGFWGKYAVFTPVPIPGAVWLLGSGLIGIVGIRKKFKK